jgi:hypothetical protein
MHNVRYFSYCLDDSNEVDIVEVSEAQFMELCRAGGSISSETHTMFENGVNQTCFTVEPQDYPQMGEL